jgi:hypothetical protein
MLNQQQISHPSPMDRPFSADSCSGQEPREQRRADLPRSLVSAVGDGSTPDRWAITMAMSLSFFSLDDQVSFYI